MRVKRFSKHIFDRIGDTYIDNEINNPKHRGSHAKKLLYFYELEKALKKVKNK